MGIKHTVNENFFDTWNANMSYALGFIYADGTLQESSRGKYLKIVNTDPVIIYTIKEWMRSQHNISIIKPSSNNSNRKTRYILKIGNKYVYHRLSQIGLEPRKSLTMRMPVVPKRYFRDFLRGYFDGDGCVHLSKKLGASGKPIIEKLSVIFTSGSRVFLEELLSRLRKEADLRQEKIYSSKRSYQLRLATADSVTAFKLIYTNNRGKFYLTRKFNIFDEYFQLRPTRIDERVANILESHQ